MQPILGETAIAFSRERSEWASLPLQTGTALSQYPVIWPDLASHVIFSAPSRLYPSLQRTLQVDPYELSQFPSINPLKGGVRVWHFKTMLKKKEPQRFNTVSTNELKVQTILKEHGYELFGLTPDGDEKLAGFIISCLISGVVRDKMSPSVKHVLHTARSNSWDNARVVSGDDCWPGH